jgi:hypothetical protein
VRKKLIMLALASEEGDDIAEALEKPCAALSEYAVGTGDVAAAAKVLLPSATRLREAWSQCARAVMRYSHCIEDDATAGNEDPT